MIDTLLRSKQYQNKKNNHLIMNYFRPPAWKMPCALLKTEFSVNSKMAPKMAAKLSDVKSPQQHHIS